LLLILVGVGFGYSDKNKGNGCKIAVPLDTGSNNAWFNESFASSGFVKYVEHLLISGLSWLLLILDSYALLMS